MRPDGGDDDIHGGLSAQQRTDIRLGEWMAEQRRMHAIDKFLWFVTGAGLGAALSRLFS